MALHRIGLLDRMAEFLANYEDWDDGTDGPRPNTAMQLRQDVEEAIADEERKLPRCSECQHPTYRCECPAEGYIRHAVDGEDDNVR